MAQLVEHILGKDEVPGPNPGSSSKHPRYSLSVGALVFYGGFLKCFTIISADICVENMAQE